MAGYTPEPTLAIAVLTISKNAASGLKQDLLHCPITALAFYTCSDDQQRYVLAGEDVWLTVYSPGDHHLCGRLKISGYYAIHGISVSSNGDLLVWGGSSISIVPAASVSLLVRGRGADVREPYQATACDWVYDARMSPYDSARGVIVTAHNEIVPFTVESASVGSGGSGEVGVTEPRPVWGGLLFLSRPILYTATVEWTAPDELLVVAGTVFGEIVVWKCSLGKEVHQLRELFVLSGHEGSIFGVALSPEVELVPGSGQKRRLLASCSDDRTVRIWDITESPKEEHTTAERTEMLEEVRETGFGSTKKSEAHSTTTSLDSAGCCLAVAVGHASRIWHVRFACGEAIEAGQIEVYSFGEDTTVQKWRLAGDGGIREAPQNAAVTSDKACPYTLEHVNRVACHNGKHIWSCAITSNGPGRTCIVTGGADGKVTLLSSGSDAVAARDSEPGARSVVLSLDDVMRSLGTTKEGSAQDGCPESRQTKKDGFLRYAFLAEDRLLVSTVSGRLLLGDVRNGVRWTEVAASSKVQDDLKGYVVVRTVAPGTAILGSTNGHLYAFREAQGLEEIAQLPGKITDVLCIPDHPREELMPELRIFVTVLGSTEGSIFTLDTQGPNIIVKESPSLALHMGFVVTSVGVCGDLLLLGSRKGVITVYEERAGIYVHQVTRNDCKTKGGDAITSIVTLPPLQGAQPKYVLTTCRDGKYRIYEVQSAPAGFVLQLRHETAPPLGPMLEGAKLVRSDRGDLELIIFGFRSTNFVVWNETLQHELASVACGGAHRTFDYVSDPTNANKLRFVYTKASAMGIYSQDEPSVQVVRAGGHGREIRAVASDGIWPDSRGLIATGAEDTCIRIWECSRDMVGTVTTLRCLAVLQKHTAGLQALKWERNGYLLSSAGAEEFFVWKMTSLESEYRGLAVVCEAAYPFRTPDGDLRITDFDSHTLGSTQHQHQPFTARGILVTMVFSNSVLKTYFYTRMEGFRCLQSGKYTGACLTQVRHMLDPAGRFATVGKAVPNVITGSTDGIVAVWRATSPDGDGEADDGFRIVCTARSHQNSVKSLEVVGPFAAMTYHVYTGGDDNALGMHRLAARAGDVGATGFRFAPICRVKDAHAAAVTGVKLLRQDRNVYSYLATVSNDQRLKIWRVTAPSGTEPLRVALLYDTYSALADPGGLEIIDGGNLMVAGVGMEIWDFFRGDKVKLL